MLFFDGIFLVFLVALLLLSGLVVRSVRGRIWLYLVASYVFYGAWDWRFLFLIFGSTTLDFYVARAIPAAEASRKRALLVLSLAVNLGSLAVFKYLDFGIGSLNALVGTEIPLAKLTLPVGISFFTFQSMSYTIDVYRGHLEPDADFPTFVLFVSFFPQLVAGPIIRAADFLPQVTAALSRPLHDVGRAAPLFVFGLFKKVVVADHLATIVDAVFANPQAYTMADRWLGNIAFAGQIYCDFSGYTDMALALCILLGFQFPDNFRSPYLSLGPQGFWRRWHISLSTWLRDYLYISLGGSRSGVAKMYYALFMTMVLGGLWHGAAWTFVLWGVFHGSLLIVERLLLDRGLGHPGWVVVRWPVFFVLTLIGWMVFRAESWAQLSAMADGLWRWEAPHRVSALAVGIPMAYVAVEQITGELNRRFDLSARFPLATVALAGLLLPLCFLLRPDRSPQFIYFQF